MADKLYQFLQSAERVLYREPEDQSGWFGHFGLAAVMGALGPMMDASRGGLTTFLAMLLVLVASWTTASRHSAGGIEAAVTDRRVLRVKGEGRSFEFTEILVEEVELIEVLGRAVRVTKTNGSIVVLDHLANAPEVGLALARAADKPPPWIPGRKERLAEEAVVLAGFAAGALAYALALGADEDAAGSAALLSRIGDLMLAFAVGAVGWVVGTLSGLALLHPHLTRAEMRAWMRQSAIFAP